jgi:hypothetical protein
MRGTWIRARLTRAAALAVLAALATGITACGSDEGVATPEIAKKAAKGDSTAGLGKLKVVPGTAQEEEVQAVYGRFLEAHVHGRGKEACALMTPKSRWLWTRVKPKLKLSCAEVMRRIDESAGNYLKVGRLLGATIGFEGNPNWAIVKYDDLYSTPSQVPLTRIGGTWKVDTYRNQMDIGTPET